MALQFRITKLPDKEIYAALERVSTRVKNRIPLFIHVDIPHMGVIDMRKANDEKKAIVQNFLNNDSQLIPNFFLKTGQGNIATQVIRTPDKPTDTVNFPDDWANEISDAISKADSYANILTAIREELKAPDLEASLRDSKDDSWSRYRDAQTAVVNSLQQATETLLIQASQKTAELDKARAERFEKLERDLRDQIDQERKSLQETADAERKSLQESQDQRIEALRAKEKALADKEASFETKESHYVARQKQAEQIKQVQEWLKKWDLTEGTHKKRQPVMWLYIFAIVAMGVLTFLTADHSFKILDSAESIAKLAWWQWTALWVKTAIPLGAFITFVIYFIRWSGDWARQHSEEEFRNRTLLVDIGRASWLLEAVRDAQERNKEIPKELMHELSHNLFANSVKAGSDIHPQAVSDILLQGLSSVRVKSADGSEVEATRNGKKK